MHTDILRHTKQWPPSHHPTSSPSSPSSSRQTLAASPTSPRCAQGHLSTMPRSTSTFAPTPQGSAGEPPDGAQGHSEDHHQAGLDLHHHHLGSHRQVEQRGLLRFGQDRAPNLRQRLRSGGHTVEGIEGCMLGQLMLVSGGLKLCRGVLRREDMTAC